MAKFNVVGLDSMQKMLVQRGGAAAKAAPKMLKAGAKVLIEAQKKSIKDFDVYDSGELYESIKASPMRRKDDDYFVEVFPHGVDSKGVRNATKGFVAEYGTSRRPFRPWMSTAASRSIEDISKAMREVWEAENK